MNEIRTPKLDEIGLLAHERLEQGRELHEYLVGMGELLDEVGTERKPFAVFYVESFSGTGPSVFDLEFESMVLILSSLGVGVSGPEQDEPSNVYACVFNTGQVRLLGVGYPTGQIEAQLEACGYDYSRISRIMLRGALEHSRSIFEVKPISDVLFTNNEVDAVSALNNAMQLIHDEVVGGLTSPAVIESPSSVQA